MASSAQTLLAVGAGVLAPTLLGGARGVVVAPYVTPAHGAAMASLRASPICGVAVPANAVTINDAFLEVHRALMPLRGQLNGTLAQLTAADASELLARFIAAARAGVAEPAVRVGEGQGYRVTTLTGPPVPVPVFGMPELPAGTSMDRGYQEHIADMLADGNEPDAIVPLTDLGRAMLAAAIERRRLWYITALDAASGFKASSVVCAKLAVEMDDAGYLITGEPVSPTIIGGLGAAWDASVDFVLGGVGDLALSKVGLLVIAGLVVWRTVR